MSGPRVVPAGRLILDQPPELVVHDELQPCPYLEERMSRLPLRIPARGLERHELEQRLSRGDRRQGLFLYRPACPGCVACEPIRLDLSRFEPNRSQRRTLARGDRELSVELGEPLADQERVNLYNRHKSLRGLSAGQGEVDVRSYREFLAMTCCDTIEIRYRLRGQLVGVAIADRSSEALSAVYCYYDPTYERLGLGTYSILKQLELCRMWELQYLYLGLYIAESLHMRYKARFLPHERLLDGQWREFTREPERSPAFSKRAPG